MIILDTADQSTAVDEIQLSALTRNVTVLWRSGSYATYQVRRRDQLRLLWCEMTARDLGSFGAFANWAKYANEQGQVASLAA